MSKQPSKPLSPDLTQPPAGAPTRRRRRGVPLMLATALGSSALASGAPSAAAAPPDESDAASGSRTSQAAAEPATAPVTSAPLEVLAAPVRAAVQSTYRVKAGDTVSHIAQRTGSSVAAIVAANALGKDAFIREGQTLVLPGRGGGAGATATGSGHATATSGTYTVRRGDTVSGIAARHGTTVAAVTAANGLGSDGFIREGQRLTLPASSRSGGGASARPTTPSATGYTVRAGDTLSHIAARTGTSLSALRAANPSLDKAASLQIGQRLAIPGSASSGMSNTFLGRTYPDATVRSAEINRAALAARAVPSRSEMQSIIAATATRYGVDPALAQAIAYQESGFSMRAVSPANAVGAMQVVPSSGHWTSEMAGRQLDLLDPQDNATAGVLLLRAHGRTGADQSTVIAAYYQGMSSVRKHGMYADTRRYVANVQTLMGQYR